MPDAMRTHVQDECHRAERQPEAGCEYRPRVGEQDAEQGEGEYLSQRKITFQPQCGGDCADHIHGALRGYAVAGQQRVGECHQQGDRSGGFARG
jgi:hypothetical protein